MTMAETTSSVASGWLHPTDQRLWAGLARHEWLPVRRLHGGFLMAWLAGFWILQLVDHPGWLIAFGLLYTVIVTPGMAGTDVMSGTEEFSFSLSPGRGPLFLTRMGIGLAFLLVTTGVGSLAVAYDVPQALWSLVASSGITEPSRPVVPSYLYPMALLVPLAAFAGSFTIAGLAGSRGTVWFSWIGGLVGTGIVVYLTLLAESLVWNKPTGWFACVALLLTSVLVLLYGYTAYLDKEAVIGGGRVTGGRTTTGIVIAIIAVILVFFVFMSLFWVSQRDTSTAFTRRASESLTIEPDPIESAD
jgi:hypothetical protein